MNPGERFFCGWNMLSSYTPLSLIVSHILVLENGSYTQYKALCFKEGDRLVVSYGDEFKKDQPIDDIWLTIIFRSHQPEHYEIISR